MIPGTHVCPSGWTHEYQGYLMTTASDGRHYRTEYICVDGVPDVVPGGNGDGGGQGVLYHVRAKCGALHCPPYEDDREVTCVVCTK